MTPTGRFAQIWRVFEFHIMVAVLAWGFWRVNEKKDASLRDLFDQVATLGRAQTEAVTKVEAALVALKEAIAELSPEARTSVKTRTES